MSEAAAAPSVEVGTPPPSAELTPPAGNTTELGAAAPPSAEPEVAKPAEPSKPDEAAKPTEFDPAKLTLPEGLKSDDPLFKSFAETLADAKLGPQERGQKLLDVYQTAVKAGREAQIEAWKSTNDQWVKDVKADPEIGGAKFESTKASISRAIDSLGPADAASFRQGLDATGAGNHPAIWKGLAKMAAVLTEGGHVQGSPSKGSPDIGATFFPNSKMKG
jgi:hypothetical protein